MIMINKKNRNLIIVFFLSLGFFLLTSVNILLNQTQGGYFLWGSPDESANYFSTLNYAISGELSHFDSVGILSKGWTSPRSLVSDAGFLKPVSFPGIILIFGSIASIYNLAIIPFLTSFFAALAIFIFYLLVRRIFSDRVALWSAFLLAFFPVYIYYSVRALFHNVLFITLFIFALYFISGAIIKVERKNILTFKKIKDDLSLSWKEQWNNFFGCQKNINRWFSFLLAYLGGFFIGLALITRTSEALWLLPLLFLFWLFYLSRFGFIRLLFVIIGIFSALLPAAFYNQLLYGSFLYGGYRELNNSVDEISQTGSSLVFSLDYLKDSLIKLKDLIFYFGFKPLQSLKMFQLYIVQMFPLLFWPGLAGFLMVLITAIYQKKKKLAFYLLGGLLISFFLILYYGSWKFHDNPDVTRATIGNSYTRYWLPIYLWLMPLAALFLVYFSRALFSFKKIEKKWQKHLASIWQIIFIFIYSTSSLFFVFFGSEEGLVYSRYSHLANKNAADMVLNFTESNSIIISKYNDKFFFPQRRVMVASFPDDDLTSIVKEVISSYPVYYFHFKLKEEDLQFLNDRRLSLYNLRIEPVLMTGIDTYLYRLIDLDQLKIEND